MGCFGIVLGQVNVSQSQVGPMVELRKWKFTGFNLSQKFLIFR